MQLVVTNQSNQNHNKTISAGPGWAGSASNCQKGKNMKQNRKRKETAGMNFLRYLGPGLLVTVGFIDPGNWASNIAAGSGYGYELLWMVTLSTIMLIFLQHNAAHLGIADDHEQESIDRDDHEGGLDQRLHLFAALVARRARCPGKRRDRLS